MRSCSCIENRNDCTRWQVIPAIVATAVCASGVVHMLIQKKYFRIAPYGVGTISSLYLVTLSYDYKLRRSLEDSSDILEAETAVLRGENTKLQRNVETFGEQNQTLSATVKQLEGANAELNASLTLLKGELQQLKAIRTFLDKFKEAIAGHQGGFDDQLTALATQVEKVTKNTELQLELLDFLKSANLQQRVDGLTTLHQKEAQLLVNIAKHDITLRVKTEELTRTTADLAKIRVAFEDLLSRFTSKLEGVADARQQLQKATELLQNLQKKD